jgi:hypothetical protein
MTVTITKGLITSQDQANYDGVKSTVTRRDSTGGTVSGLPVGAVVDVLATYGYGEDYTQATITRATNAIGSANRTLLFRPGTWEITSNLTIGSNFSIYMPAGAVFDVASGATLTLSGAFFNDHATYSSGAGTVSLAEKSFAGNVDIADHDADTTGLKLNGVLVTASAAEINSLGGITSTVAELNTLDGVTATTAELNENDRSAIAVSNNLAGLRTYFYNDSGATEYLQLTISASTAAGAWESWGPGTADNVDADIPAGAKAVTIRVRSVLTTSGAGAFNFNLYARPGDTTHIVGAQNNVSSFAGVAAGGSEVWAVNDVFTVAFDTGDDTFDLHYTESNCTAVILGHIEKYYI